MAKLRPAMTAAGAAATVGFLPGIWRFFRDREASLAGKGFVVLSLAYIVFPADVIADVIPFIGWLDDMGVAAIAIAYLHRVSRRYPALEGPAPAQPGAVKLPPPER
ncbi:MAG: DUF1232 domain-containing protein [Myxococcales bacterium]|nr:DUF1232 domain-containing protein [Myxococcales bacterium]